MYTDKDDEDSDDDDEAPAQGGGGNSDADFSMLKRVLLHQLNANGKPTSSGKLGHELNAKKKPISAALFSLLEEGAVQRIEDGRLTWEVTPSGAAACKGSVGGVPARYTYDAEQAEVKKSKLKGGPRRTNEDFDVIKKLVRNHVAAKGQAGMTAGALGYEMNANRKVVNAALYACEKEGTAWVIGDRNAGIKLRWSGTRIDCDEAFPACFSYDAPTGGSAVVARSEGSVVQPAAKRARTAGAAAVQRPAASQAAPQTAGQKALAEALAWDGDEDFESLKLIARAALAAKGDAGSSSDAVAFELGGQKRAVAAALFSCLEEGTVQNLAPEDDTPYWISSLAPPPAAAATPLPAKFAQGGAEAKPKGGFPSLQPAPQVSDAPASGGGAAKIGTGALPNGALPQDSPVAALNQWSQQERRALLFVDLGLDAQTGEFLCQAVVDGEPLQTMGARNKKEAKKQAAAAACEQLGLL